MARKAIILWEERYPLCHREQPPSEALSFTLSAAKAVSRRDAGDTEENIKLGWHLTVIPDTDPESRNTASCKIVEDQPHPENAESHSQAESQGPAVQTLDPGGKAQFWQQRSRQPHAKRPDSNGGLLP